MAELHPFPVIYARQISTTELWYIKGVSLSACGTMEATHTLLSEQTKDHSTPEIVARPVQLRVRQWYSGRSLK